MIAPFLRPTGTQWVASTAMGWHRDPSHRPALNGELMLAFRRTAEPAQNRSQRNI
jgi:hypothetical protein